MDKNSNIRKKPSLLVYSPPPKSWLRSTVLASSKDNRHRIRLFILLTAVALFFVAIGGSYVVLGAITGSFVVPFINVQASQTKALVTITPLYPIVKHTYKIAIVTGQPNSAQNQAEGGRTISESQSQSMQVNATGNVVTPATNATGTLIFSRVKRRVTIPAGTSFVDKNNIALVLNAPVTLLKTGGFTVSVGAYANPASSKGQDAQGYRVVQQSDINIAASQLENSIEDIAQTAIQAQIKASEQLVGSISCGLSSLSSNQQAGARVPNVTVSVTGTCRGEVFNVQPSLALAANLLKRDVTKIAGYAIVGSVTTRVLAQPKLIDTQGTLSLDIMASGTAFYQFTTTQTQAFARLIAGKSLADAQALLLKQTGISQAAINIAGNPNNRLPGDPGKIAFVISK